MITDRLEIRLPTESDRDRFVEFFTDETFMVFSGGVLMPDEANVRFDRMCRVAADLPFAKQAVVDRSSGLVVGYCGVDHFEFEGEPSLEFGYRLCVEARGQGFATEAGLALIASLLSTYQLRC